MIELTSSLSDHPVECELVLYGRGRTQDILEFAQVVT